MKKAKCKGISVAFYTSYEKEGNFRIAIIKKTDRKKQIGENVEKLKPSNTVGEKIKRCSHIGEKSGSSSNGYT